MQRNLIYRTALCVCTESALELADFRTGAESASVLNKEKLADGPFFSVFSSVSPDEIPAGSSCDGKELCFSSASADGVVCSVEISAAFSQDVYFVHSIPGAFFCGDGVFCVGMGSVSGSLEVAVCSRSLLDCRISVGTAAPVSRRSRSTCFKRVSLRPLTCAANFTARVMRL